MDHHCVYLVNGPCEWWICVNDDETRRPQPSGTAGLAMPQGCYSTTREWLSQYQHVLFDSDSWLVLGSVHRVFLRSCYLSNLKQSSDGVHTWSYSPSPNSQLSSSKLQLSLECARSSLVPLGCRPLSLESRPSPHCKCCAHGNKKQEQRVAAGGRNKRQHAGQDYAAD